jgi:hypothetical protein
MGREIRHVPQNWKHPKTIDKYNGKERFRGMFQRDFKEAYADFEKELKEWYKEREAFENGKVFSYGDKFYSKKNGNTYEDWAGEPPTPPNPYDYMPYGKWYQLFETVSEGTPLSPPFETKKELIEWLVNNKDYWGHQWTKEQAEGMIKNEYVPSMAIIGNTLYKPEELAELKH